MSMGSDNFLGIMLNGGFYKGVGCLVYQNRVPKGIVCLCITRIIKVVTIWSGLLFKIGVYFYGLVGKTSH